jgi:hypothetical protein
MKQFNDSSGVKTCLNYFETPVDLSQMSDENNDEERLTSSRTIICNCCSNYNQESPIRFRIEKTLGKKSKTPCFEKQRYITSYKSDYKPPLPIVENANNNRRKTPKDISITKTFKSNTENYSHIDSRLNTTNQEVFFTNLAQSKPTHRKPAILSKKSSKTNEEKISILKNQNLSYFKNIPKTYPTLKDHFVDKRSKTPEHKRVFAKCTNTKFDVVSVVSSLNSATCILENDSYNDARKFNSVEVADLNDFKQKSDLKKKLKKKLTSQATKAFFVEGEHELEPTRRRNICKHINLVCGKCVKSINLKTNKLFQFDLEDCRKKFEKLS